MASFFYCGPLSSAQLVPLASSEATAYFRLAPGRIPERHQRQWV